MNDLRTTIIPKSDQLNADDLIGRTMTIKVTRVSLATDADQPVAINYEGDAGKPYKPCKSMRRVLVNCWGPDGNQYAGRLMTLYRDEGVQFGGLKVGGIRISHLSHIDGPVTMALTATRASRKPFTVKPLAATEQQSSEKRRTVRDILAAIQARIDAGDTLADIEASEDVKLIRTKGSDTAKAELGALLSRLAGPADGEPDGEYGEGTPA